MNKVDREFFIKSLRNIADKLEEDNNFNLEGVNIDVSKDRVVSHHYFGQPIMEDSYDGMFSIEFNLFDGDSCSENMIYIVNELENHIGVNVDYNRGRSRF